jgi:lysocardiolipin and lysophospholipid acyltransferase
MAAAGAKTGEPAQLPGATPAPGGNVPPRPNERVIKPGDPRSDVPERLVALVFLVALLLSALIGSVLIILPSAILLLPLPLAPTRNLYRLIVNTVAAAWFTYASALIELVARVSMRVSGPGGGPRLEGERVAVLICNHHSRVDWLFLWPLACRMVCAGRLKIALKEDMKKIPFFGWAMQAFQFVFLARRNRTLDLQRIERTLSYLAHDRDEPLLLLIFPEGSDLSADNQARDAAFAARSNERAYRHTLHPRTAGFAQVLRTLGDKLDCVYDATVWYERHPDEVARHVRPSEKSLLRGTFPRTVHCHVERFGRSQLPPSDDEAALSEWLQTRWALKEAMLDKLLVEGVPPPRALKSHPSLAAEYRLALAGWGLASALLLVGLVAWLPLLVYTAAGIGLFALLTSCVGGLDNVEVALKS